MSITVLHGENTVASRQRLHDLLANVKKNGQLVKTVEGNKLNNANIELLIGESGLFGGERLIVIEELHSLPLGKKRDALVAQVAQITDDLIIWEKKKLTALMLKKLGSQVTAEVFEPSKNVWKLIALIGGDTGGDTQKILHLYQLTLKQEDPFYLLTLFIRQIRLLIQIKTNAPVKLAPFQVSQLKSQAKGVSLMQLLRAHHQLLEIEFGQKSGATMFPLEQELFLWLHGFGQHT